MNQKTFIKSLDVNNNLPTLISTDVATPHHHPRAAMCNGLQKNEILLFVKSPLFMGEVETPTFFSLKIPCNLKILMIYTSRQ